MKYLLALCLLLYMTTTFALPLISEYEQPYEIHHAWDLQYDKETRHGVTQGAVFP